MNINYKIIEKYPSSRQIVVRFFTDLVDENYLASEIDPITRQPINLDEFDVPRRCRTDVAITLPLRVLTPEEEKNIIMGHCMWKWLQDEERVINAITTPDTELSSVIDSITIMPTSVGILNFDPTLSLQEKKDLMWEKIKTERDSRIQSGGYKVGIKWFDSNTFSRTQQIGMMLMGANLPTNIMWKTMDKSFILMTPTLAQQIFGAAAMSDTNIFTAAESHKSAMEAMEDPSQYGFLSGWPVSFND